MLLNKILISSLFAISTLLFMNLAYAQPMVTHAQIQQLVNNFLTNHQKIEHISGISASVWSPNIYPERQYFSAGYLSFQDNNRITPNTVFQVGSITKTFTATIMLQLEAEGKLNINNQIGQYLPQYPQWKNVTIKELLNMSSGVPLYTDSIPFFQYLAAHPNKHWTSPEIINYTGKKPLQFSPGSNWQYSNSNYILAGMIIRKVTGHSVAYNLQQLFNQLHLSRIYYSPYVPPYNMATPYYFYKASNLGFYKGESLKKYNLSWAGSAGAIITTPTTIAQFVHDLLVPGKVLPAKQLQQMLGFVQITGPGLHEPAPGKPIPNQPTTAVPNGYGLGMFYQYTPSKGEGVAYYYEGATIGGRFLYIDFIKQDLLITIALNSNTNAADDITGLANNIFSLLANNNSCSSASI